MRHPRPEDSEALNRSLGGIITLGSSNGRGRQSAHVLAAARKHVWLALRPTLENIPNTAVRADQ